MFDWLKKDPDDDKPKDSSKDAWKEKRQLGRVDLGSEEQLVVQIVVPGTDSSASTVTANVRNVSARGCRLGFKTMEEAQKVKEASNFSATLTVDGVAIPIYFTVLHRINDLEIGIRFKPPYSRDLEKLEKFIEPRFLGRTLREIDKAALQKSTDENLRWFHGLNETNLFSWQDPSTHKIRQQQLVFLSMFVEWKDGEPLKTGQVSADSSATEGKLAWDKADLLEFDAINDSAIIKQARVILESSEIDETIKKTFLEKLT